MMLRTRDVFNYFQCDDCCCLQIESVPANIADYYPSDYYSFSTFNGNKFAGFSGVINKFIFDYAIFHRGLFQYFLEHLINPFKYSRLLSDLKVSKDSTILDVGCGNGEGFLYPLAEIGFNNLLGCDPYLPNNINYQNGLKILSTDIFSINGKWEYIFYHHAFEHIANPQDHLIKIKSLLEDHGLCILRVPVPSYAWEHYGIDWYQLDAPRHFYLYSIKSIEILANSTGFKLNEVIFDSTHHQFTNSEFYRNDIPLNQKPNRFRVSYLKKMWNKLKYKKMAKVLNASKRGDQAIFILQKK
jgi:cyclopropane fatty-acyl-phospholipid synthase-like methyltransferase